MEIIEWPKQARALESLPVPRAEPVGLVREGAPVGVVAALLPVEARHDGWFCEVPNDCEVREVSVAVAVLPMSVTIFRMATWLLWSGTWGQDGAHVLRDPPSIALHDSKGRAAHRQRRPTLDMCLASVGLDPIGGRLCIRPVVIGLALGDYPLPEVKDPPVPRLGGIVRGQYLVSDIPGANRHLLQR